MPGTETRANSPWQSSRFGSIIIFCNRSTDLLSSAGDQSGHRTMGSLFLKTASGCVWTIRGFDDDGRGIGSTPLLPNFSCSDAVGNLSREKILRTTAPASDFSFGLPKRLR